jgi:hypothetical protein
MLCVIMRIAIMLTVVMLSPGISYVTTLSAVMLAVVMPRDITISSPA